MTSVLIDLAEANQYQDLFIRHLRWGAPDHRPITVTIASGETYTATNVSSFKGLRVWVHSGRPGSAAEAAIDREIAKTSTDRLVIFFDEMCQVWRWPVRTIKGSSTRTRLSSHRHKNGTVDPKFLARLEAIQLPADVVLDINSVLARVRAAFDVEAQNETRHASRLMARMYTSLERAYPVSSDQKQRDHAISMTMARLLFLMFGDDTEMWEQDRFRDLVHYGSGAEADELAALLNDLFRFLNAPPQDGASDTRTDFEGLPYINGGLFSEIIDLPPVGRDFREAILDACAVDWSAISPAIFGSMFQSVRDAETRRSLGEHYTSEENILRTLGPLFLDELRSDFEAALARDSEQKRKNSLDRLWERLGRIRFLDPACGCGNFIIVAYRELRDLELLIMEQLQELAGTAQLAFDPTLNLKVSLDHFYGIEIDEWPAKIAETAMFLVDRQCDLRLKDRFGQAPQRLPIQTQATIATASPDNPNGGNALLSDWSVLLDATEDTYIAGNPPFLGKTERSTQQTADMKVAWGAHYTGEADFVTSWFAKSVDFFGDVAGNWAFVSTNSACQGNAVPKVYSYIFGHGWSIRFAHRNFEWQSEAPGAAAVHCVIVGFGKTRRDSATLFEYATPKSPHERLTVSRINAYLIDGPDVLVWDRRIAISPQMKSDIRFGSMAADGGGLLLKVAEYEEVIAKDPVAASYVRPFVGAKELLNNKKRWCIWMPEENRSDVARSPILQDRIERVRRFRTEEAKDAGVRASGSTPHRFSRVQQPEEPYLCIPRHVPESYRFYPSARFDVDTISGDANFVVDDPDGFFLGLLSSSMFMTWQRTVGGRIKNDPRFASTVTWNTFPVPEVNSDQYADICQRAAGILAARALRPSMSLADQYEPSQMHAEIKKAHSDLDEAVDGAFGFEATLGTERERQKVLFSRYVELLDTPSA